MEKGNVLVIGNSGVGKSTLINAVLGEEKAKTSWGGSKGTTNKLEIYESEAIPFRLIDTVGFEPSFFQKNKAVNLVKKWSKESMEEKNEERQINVIWFCVEGTSSKLFPETIESMSKATAMWETVPVIVVITKSYSVPEREMNIAMVNNAFAKQKKYSKNLRKIIPVVAETYRLNDTAWASPDGIAELISATNELMPDGIKAASNDVAQFILRRKKRLAQGVVGTAIASGVTVGAVPIPIADAAILSPIEVAEVNAIAYIYGLNKDEKSKQFLNSIVQVGTVSMAAKTAISALKGIPGINVAAYVLNAVIAGSIVGAIGEGSIYAFEKVYLGEKSVDDIDWVKQVIESKFAAQFVEKVKEILEKMVDGSDSKGIAKMISKLFGS